jgi:hypothetical protein
MTVQKVVLAFNSTVRCADGSQYVGCSFDLRDGSPMFYAPSPNGAIRLEGSKKVVEVLSGGVAGNVASYLALFKQYSEAS